MHIYGIQKDGNDNPVCETAKNIQETPTAQFTNILMHIFGIQKDGNDNPVCETAKETQMYRTVFWTLGEDDLGEWH